MHERLQGPDERIEKRDTLAHQLERVLDEEKVVAESGQQDLERQSQLRLERMRLHENLRELNKTLEANSNRSHDRESLESERIALVTELRANMKTNYAGGGSNEMEGGAQAQGAMHHQRRTALHDRISAIEKALASAK